MFIIVAFSHIIFVNQPTITTMASILLDLSNGPIISILISCHSSYGISNSPSFVIYKSTCPEIMSPQWNHLRTIQAHLPQRPPFSQHVSWQCCNPPDIPSSMAEILLFNSVFHDRVTSVSVSTLKPPLGAIGVFPLKPWASPILSVCI